jgi:hypothetical protein
MDKRALQSTANLASYRAWSQLCAKKSGLQTWLKFCFLIPLVSATCGSFVRLGAEGDVRLQILRLSVLTGLIVVVTVLPLTVFLIRFICYRRRHPWTPPQPLDLAPDDIRRRMDRRPRALEI